jgi:prolyl 4-hydroxylase
MSCDYLPLENRCPIDPDAVPAWKPGDLDAMFRRLVEEPFASEHEVQILSRDPWVITMEGIVNDEEAERLIELGATEGYKPSSEVGEKLADGSFGSRISDGRTSMNAWCQNEVRKHIARFCCVPVMFLNTSDKSNCDDSVLQRSDCFESRGKAQQHNGH